MIIKATPFWAFPCASVRVLTLQFVQRRSRHISSHSIDFINIYLFLYQAIRLYHHLTILGEFASIIVIAFFVFVISCSILCTNLQCAKFVSIGTIYRTFIAATEDVTIAVCHAFSSSYLTTMNVDVGLSEDEALTLHVERSNKSRIHIHSTITAPAVLTATTSEDVTFHETAKHVDVGSSSPENAGTFVIFTSGSRCLTF